MRSKHAILIAVAALAATPAIAAPHRAPVTRDTVEPYAMPNEHSMARQQGVVTFGNQSQPWFEQLGVHITTVGT